MLGYDVMVQAACLQGQNPTFSLESLKLLGFRAQACLLSAQVEEKVDFVQLVVTGVEYHQVSGSRPKSNLPWCMC